MNTGVGESTVNLVINSLCDSIANLLSRNQVVRLYGFGAFRTTISKEHKGRNPRTGALITIPETKVVRFRPSKFLKEKVNE